MSNEEPSPPPARPDKPRPAVKLDETDLKLLRYLVEDARLSQRALGRAIGMSAPAVAERISRLEASGVIRGYHAELDYTALKRPMTVLIGVLSERSSTQLELAQRLAQLPEVERVDVTSGSTDLLLRMRVRDQAHLNDVLFNNVLLSTPEIRHTDTYLALVTVEPDSFDDRLLQSLADEMAEPGSLDQA
jgi:Lrp/AsnC family leucine-responsive transcriptional regulator